MNEKTFKLICEKNGVKYRFDEKENILSVDCKPGRVMAGSGLHFRDIFLTDGPSFAEAFDDLADDICPGTEPCTITPGQCDICEENT